MPEPRKRRAGTLPRPARAASCVHSGLNSSALRTPSQCAAGCGGRQRKSPTGGAANGIPLNIRTFESLIDRRHAGNSPAIQVNRIGNGGRYGP